HARRSASACGRPPSMTMIATRSAHDSRWCGGTVRTSPPGAAIGPAFTASTHVAQASLTSLHPPYAAAGSTATRFPPSATWRASWCHCCCPAASAVEGEAQLPHLADPVPAPALHAEGRHHTRDSSKQRQRIEGAFAHPQRVITLLQRGGVEITL